MGGRSFLTTALLVAKNYHLLSPFGDQEWSPSQVPGRDSSHKKRGREPRWSTPPFTLQPKVLSLLARENLVPRSELLLNLWVVEESGRITSDGNLLNLITLLDRVHNILAIDYFAEDSVLSIKPWCRYMRDEELASISSWSSVRHRKNARSGVTKRGVELILETVSWPSSSRSGWVAALDHEVIDDSVKRNAVIKAVLGEVHKVGDGYWSLIGCELELDISLGSLNCCGELIRGGSR